MPIPVKKINNAKGNGVITIPFLDEQLVLTYNREKYTPKVERELRDRMMENLPGTMLAEFLMTLLIDWDAVDVHSEDREKAEEMETRLMSQDPPVIPGLKDYEAAGIRMVKLPLNADTFDALISIEAQGSIVEALSETQRPKAKQSDFMSNT